MAPIANITRALYVSSPREGVAAVVRTKHTGHGLFWEERLSYQSSSDWSDTHQVRTTEDGGRTWSEWKLIHKEWPTQGGFAKTESPTARCYDPVSGKLLQFLLRQILVGEGPDALDKSWKQDSCCWANKRNSNYKKNWKTVNKV